MNIILRNQIFERFLVKIRQFIAVDKFYFINTLITYLPKSRIVVNSLQQVNVIDI